MPTLTPEVIAQKVLDHALTHWNDGKGWDSVYECNDVSDIVAVMKEYGFTTLERTLAHYKADAEMWEEQRSNCY